MPKITPYKRRRIRRLSEDISEIEAHHYQFVEVYDNDPDAQIHALQLKKTLLIRSLVIETHLAIEEMLDSAIKNKIYLINSKSKKPDAIKAREYFYHRFDDAEGFFSGGGSIGFKRKIILLRLLGVIGKRLYEDLEKLNSLRNRCGHHWIIDTVVRRGVRREKPKKYVLTFEGENLFSPASMVSFLSKYSDIYLKLVDKAYPW